MTLTSSNAPPVIILESPAGSTGGFGNTFALVAETPIVPASFTRGLVEIPGNTVPLDHALEAPPKNP